MKPNPKKTIRVLLIEGKYMIRWLLLPVGLLFQLITYLAYPFIIVYWYVKVKGKTIFENAIEDNTKFINPNKTIEDILKLEDPINNNEIRNQYFLDDDDSHGALVHAHLWANPVYKPLAERGLDLLVSPEGSLYRRQPNNTNLPVSGDCLSAWVFSYISSGVNKPELVHRIGKHYIKNCLGLKTTENEYSARNSNSGVNFVNDGAYFINQPCFGPQYYTSAALLALCAREAKGVLPTMLWNIAYKLNYVLMGGWLWWVQPIVYPKSDFLYYTHHVTALNIWSIAKCKGSTRTLKHAMVNIAKTISPGNNINPMIYALGIDIDAITSETDYELAKATLCTMTNPVGFKWQKFPFNRNYYSEGEDGKRLFTSIFALPARLLKRNEDKFRK